MSISSKNIKNSFRIKHKLSLISSILPLLLSNVFYVLLVIMVSVIFEKNTTFYLTIFDKIFVLAAAISPFFIKFSNNKGLLCIFVIELVLLIYMLYYPSIMLLLVITIIVAISIYSKKIILLSALYTNIDKDYFQSIYLIRLWLKAILLFLVGVIINLITVNTSLYLTVFYLGLSFLVILAWFFNKK